MSAEDIKLCATEMALHKIFSVSTPVHSIKKMHFVTVLLNGSIECKEFTNKQDQEENDATHKMPENNESTNESDSDKWYDKQCQKHGHQQKSMEGNCFQGR